ncbi:Hypothetical predicted protein [Podarcis lilfordi]|uniref:Uncharacterized protein n=1 Tax=Podarcis lilfordi TaxID=74358 RepID=A0AA35JS72_9SAUR|nr:Hypothetical predicted protein [Podarcis lilfordi]
MYCTYSFKQETNILLTFQFSSVVHAHSDRLLHGKRLELSEERQLSTTTITTKINTVLLVKSLHTHMKLQYLEHPIILLYIVGNTSNHKMVVRMQMFVHSTVYPHSKSPFSHCFCQIVHVY